MRWSDSCKRLVDVLELAHTPVAVTYADEPPEDASRQPYRVCGALQASAAGTVIDLTGGNSTCPGGSTYLGLQAMPPEHARPLREFLIDGEKLFSCPAAINRARALSKAKPPFGIAEHAVFAPLDKAPLPPDVTVFICNAWQAARLINLAYYTDGRPMECDPTGALCSAAITYPLVTGKVNVTFGDVTARRMQRYGENELFVSMPLPALEQTVASVDRCSAGTAETHIPEAMRRAMAESGEEIPEL
ncbi:MAG: DUF169 domain-containing protein [Armatimonadota bacterium]